jgi:hypothetical protein
MSDENIPLSKTSEGGAGVIDDELASLRKKRLEFLKSKFFNEFVYHYFRQEENLKALASGGGVLRDIEEGQFLPEITNSKWAMVSFYHHSFNRCSILHEHLQVSLLL